MSEPLVPPHSLEAEAAIVGACLTSPRAIDEVRSRLRPRDFFGEQHRVIYEAILALDDERRDVDFVSCATLLRDQNRLKQAGGNAMLAQLADASPSLKHLTEHVRIVADKARVRAMIAVGKRIATEGYLDVGDVQDWLESCHAEVFDAAMPPDQHRTGTLAELVPLELQRIERAREQPGSVPGIPSLDHHITRLLNGYQSGGLYVVAGRPGMGKTAWMLCEAASSARRDEPALVVSMEMAAEQLVMRLLASECQIELRRLQTGDLDDADIDRLYKVASRVAKLPMVIVYAPGATMPALRALMRRVSGTFQSTCRRPLSFAAVDYLQLMRGQGHSREERVSENTRALKQLAGEMGIPILVGSQLNREAKNRKDKRPQLEELRESGAIEQDADVVLGLYRDEYYDRESPDRGLAEVLVMKNRNGPVGMSRVRYTPEHTRFSPLPADEYGDLDDHYDGGVG